MEEYEERAIELCELCDSAGFREITMPSGYLGFVTCNHDGEDRWSAEHRRS